VRLDELDYDLPPELIAQQPLEPRDAARLLVYRRPAADRPGERLDAHFRDLPRLLGAGDLLVRNDTRVLPARTWFRRPTGGRLEVLFLAPRDPAHDGAQRWEVLVRGRPRPGERLLLDRPESAWELEVVEGYGDGRWLVADHGAAPVEEQLGRHGSAPLPPYIHAPLADPERYQTVFARHPGSAAAPTAGLHFTAGLDAALAAAGVQIVELTLHVGLGTFKPLEGETVEENRLHAEPFELSAATWELILQASREGRRVVAVGSTMVRLLEHLAARASELLPDAGDMLHGSTSLFITPGYRFRLVGATITNFHLPRTSLLALVMAFCGVAATRELYAHAVATRYRFYSLGDAMLIV
jgi:S-adenosylmethionine:tRNA ribosyltransferase-isomerase